MTKKIIVKSKDPFGEFLGSWSDFKISGFSMSLDGGLGECVIEVSVPPGTSGAKYAEGNTVEITVTDADTLARELPEPGATEALYSGVVSQFERDTVGHLVVRVVGFQTLLASDFLRSGSQTTLYSKTAGGITTTLLDQSAADVGAMARAVIDLHRTNNPDSTIHYFTGDIPDAGVTATYTFEAMTVREALDALKGMVPGCHWFADATGRVTFSVAPTTPTWSLTYGREVKSAKVIRSTDGLVNSWLVWNGVETSDPALTPIYKLYEDAASISKYGRRRSLHVDSGIRNPGPTFPTADAVGARLRAESKDPSVRAMLEVIDNAGDANGCDVEAFRPGQTVRLMNFDEAVADWTFNDNMLITEVEWRRDGATLTVDILPSGLIEQQKRNTTAIQALESRKIPTTYTT